MLCVLQSIDRRGAKIGGGMETVAFYEVRKESMHPIKARMS